MVDNDGTVDLQFDAILAVKVEMLATQQVFQESKEDLDRPSPRAEQGDDLGGNVQQVRSDAQDTVAVDARGAPRYLPRLVWREHLTHTKRICWSGCDSFLLDRPISTS